MGCHGSLWLTLDRWYRWWSGSILQYQIRFPHLNSESDHLHLSYNDLHESFSVGVALHPDTESHRLDRDIFSTRSTGGRADGANTTLGAAVDPTFWPRPRQLHFAVPLGPPHLMNWGVNAKIHIWLALFNCPLTILPCTPRVSLEHLEMDAENGNTDRKSNR